MYVLERFSSAHKILSHQIRWENRLKNDNGSICKITVDGTDFRISEPGPWNDDTSPQWYSHKFKGPGVRYEVGVCIQTGEIVWLNGPYPCGAWPDLRIARHSLVYALASGEPSEMAVADGGYNDGFEFFETPTGVRNDDQRMKSVARARHETINRRFKQFGILDRRFRHSKDQHGLVMWAIANIVHMVMSLEGTTEEEAGLFQVEYKDN